SAIEMLRGLRYVYESHHDVLITDTAVTTAVSLSKRYIADRYLPDKAIDLIDEAAAQRRIELNSPADPDGPSAGACDRRRGGRRACGRPVDRNPCPQAAGGGAGEPPAPGAAPGGAHRRPDRGSTSVSAALRNARTGLGDANRPIAALMFCGPSGVGKTRLA